MKIPSNILDRQFFKYHEEYESKALEVLRSGWYVLGKEVSSFEDEFASYTGSKYCVGLGNGLDALWISFRVLGIGTGDEVIVQGNTYIASVMGITMNGATPIFVEPNDYFNIDVEKIEEAITEKTKAILVVHLYGQASNMKAIMELARKYNLRVVEDCAQAHGAKYDRQMVGTFGDVGCFSFYPSKNLGCFGDGGAITTNNEEIANKFKVFRNYGSEKRYYNEVVGTNSRLDELQAGLLRIKLNHIQELEDERIVIANKYLNEIKNPMIRLPKVDENLSTVWHLFVIKTDKREKLITYLNEKGVGTIIHYPIPPHLSEAYKYLGFKEGDLPITENYANTVLTLPLFNGMTNEEVEYVVKTINEWK